MSLKAGIALLTIPINIALGLYVLSRDPRRTLNRLFFALTMLLALWGVGDVISLAGQSNQVVLIGRKVAVGGWMFLAPVTLHFTLVLTKRVRVLERWWLVALPYLVFGIFFIMAISTDLVFKSVVPEGSGFKLVGSPLRVPVQGAVLLILLLCAAGIIYYGIRLKERAERERMILMGLAILLPVVGSVLVEVLIPYKGIRPAVSGLDLTLVMAAIMAYAVSRRGLLGDVLSSMGRAVLPAMKDSVFVLGPTGVVEAANPAAEEFTGFAREELVGSSLASVFRDYQQYRSLAESMAGGGDFDSTARCFARDGAAKWVSVVSVPIRSGSERLIGFVVILHDITDTLELIRAEERVRVSALEADMQRDYSNELRNIIDVAGHELRHPASVFKGYTSTLIHNWDSMERETVEDFMQALDMASDRLTRLTVDLLDVSYIESEGMQLEHEHVKPQALLAAAVMEVKTRDYSQDFVIASDDDDRTILADSEKIESVLAVLLDNAAKFSPEDSPLEIGFRVEGKYAVFYVADRGRGVPEGHREKIFKRLYQVDDAQHHSTPGLGLGLYIAYEIVSAHHGWIRMDPREGGGSVFSFGLPLEP